MKKFRFLLGALVVLGLVTFFSSCNEPNGVVSIVVTPETVNAEAGDVVTFAINLDADALAVQGALGEFEITDAAGTELFTKTCTGMVDSISFDFTVPADAVEASEIVLTFTAVDGNSDKSNTKTAVITVVDNGPDLVTLAAVTLGYNNGGTASWNSSTPFFGVSNTAVTALAPSAAVADIDVALCTQNTYGLVLASPNASWFETMAEVNNNGIVWNASGKNETKLQKITSVTWDNITAEFLVSLTITPTYVGGNQANGIAATNLVAGDLVAFETADGIKGVFKVGAGKNVISGDKATAAITCETKLIDAGSASK